MAPSFAQLLVLPTGLRVGDRPPTLPHLLVSLGCIVGVLVGIFYMDTLACKDQAINFPNEMCLSYSQIEWAFTAAKAELTLAQWSAHDAVCMAISNGLHFAAALLYGGFLVSAGLALFRFFDATSRPALATMSKVVIVFGRAFTCTYVIGHSLVAAIFTQGPSQPLDAAVTAFLIISLAMLGVSVVFIIVAAVLVAVMAVRGRAAVKEVSVQGDSVEEQKQVGVAVALAAEQV